MFKRIAVMVLVISLIAGQCWAADSSKEISSSGSITASAAVLKGFLIGTDGANNVTAITIYNGTDNTGAEVVPTHGVIATNQGLNGVSGLNVDCPDGIYVEFTTSGAAEVVVFYNNI